MSKTSDERCGSHLQDGPIEAQQDAPRLVPDSVQAVRETAQEELVAQTTPGGQTVKQPVNKINYYMQGPSYFVILGNHLLPDGFLY